MAYTQVPWEETASLTYGAYGARKVLIIFSDMPLPNCSDAVERRDGYLTESDREKLRSEKVDLKADDTEKDIVWKRYSLDKKKHIFKVLCSTQEKPLTRREAYDNIAMLMNNIDNDGVVLYYVGAGKKGTGDWCFSDGYITFMDIAAMYLESAHLKGRVLTIVTDCSHSGWWVKDCERFLDNNDVKPCGHSAKEKGILIKVYASCLPSQIPTRYQLTVHGGGNDINTGDKYTKSSEYLLDTQHTFSVNSSRIRPNGETINDPCTLKPDYTWEKWRLFNRIIPLPVDNSKYSDDSALRQSRWHYVELVDDEEIIHKVKRDKPASVCGEDDYVRIIISGEGEEPPDDVKKYINDKYGPFI